MKNLADSFGVAACGLVTSILTAIAVVAVAKITGFSIFTLSIWLIVPAGAILTGFAAASGYYFGSLYFHKKAGVILLLQMVVIAGVTQLLIYYMEYSTFVLEDGRRVSDLLPFSRYIDISLTEAHYSVGRGMRDTGKVGSFGYALAIIQFIGFLIGGLGVFGFLMSKPVCQKCNMYFRPLSKRAKVFTDAESGAQYYDDLFKHPTDGPEFLAMISSDVKSEAKKGSLSIETTLYGCPKCKSQLIEDEVTIHNGEEWKEVKELNRRVVIPDGVNLTNAFRK